MIQMNRVFERSLLSRVNDNHGDLLSEFISWTGFCRSRCSAARGVVMKMNLLIVAVSGFTLTAPYCSAQEPKERANRDAHGEVLCMAITQDGQTLASGTRDKLTLW